MDLIPVDYRRYLQQLHLLRALGLRDAGLYCTGNPGDCRAEIFIQ